jgi:hypothetical protein
VGGRGEDGVLVGSVADHDRMDEVDNAGNAGSVPPG